MCCADKRAQGGPPATCESWKNANNKGAPNFKKRPDAELKFLPCRGTACKTT